MRIMWLMGNASDENFNSVSTCLYTLLYDLAGYGGDTICKKRDAMTLGIVGVNIIVKDRAFAACFISLLLLGNS